MRLKQLCSCLFIFVFLICMFSISVFALDFEDVNENDWFYDYVNFGVEKEYFNGYEDGTFKPNNHISYGEFYKIICKIKNFDIEESENNKHWAEGYAKKLYYDGNSNIDIFYGHLDNLITRKEAIRTLLFAFGITNQVRSNYYNDVPFIDMPKSTIYIYDGYIYNAYKLGIVTGYQDNTIRPDEYISRAEVATIIRKSFDVEDWEIIYPHVLEGIEIESKSQYFNSFLNDLCWGISKFPNYIIEEFKNDGSFLLTDESTFDYYPDVKIASLYQSKTSKIIFFTFGDKASLNFTIMRHVVHELAHYVYYEILSENDQANVDNIFNTTDEENILAELMNRDYCTTNSHEFWAEFIVYSLNNPDCDFSGIPSIYNIYINYFS